MLHGICFELSAQVETSTRPHANSRINSTCKDGDHTVRTGTRGTLGTRGTGRT